jgi:hypothetical protein
MERGNARQLDSGYRAPNTTVEPALSDKGRALWEGEWSSGHSINLSNLFTPTFLSLESYELRVIAGPPTSVYETIGA